jgi:hypothetical protein
VSTSFYVDTIIAGITRHRQTCAKDRLRSIELESVMEHGNTSRENAREKKIAVVLIHGMGEQKPMHTLRDFVVSVWEDDQANLFRGLKRLPDGQNHWDTWSKPDPMYASAELRRITTRRARNPELDGELGKRVDFFELHWADITADSNWGDFMRWLGTILFRNPFQAEVPPRILMVWIVMWLFVLLILGSVLTAAWPKLAGLFLGDCFAKTCVADWMTWRGWNVIAMILVVVGGSAKSFLTRYLGDVARYVSAKPRNIRVRQEARQRGLMLLHQIEESRRYDRIIVVGHSLGSILAHDLVMLAWAKAAGEIQLQENSSLYDAFRTCEMTGEALVIAAGYKKMDLSSSYRNKRGSSCGDTRNVDRDKVAGLQREFRERQRDVFRRLGETNASGATKPPSGSWLISDLVTVGSPLTHAEFLIARSLCELRAMVSLGEALRCPPAFQMDDNDNPHFMFKRKSLGTWEPHHAAAMAPVRWTNIYDPSGPLLFLSGDLVSGPLARDFGPGVVDVRVRIDRPSRLLRWTGLSHIFTHTLYWNDFDRKAGRREAMPNHIQVLRDALNLLDDPKAEERLMNGSVRVS